MVFSLKDGETLEILHASGDVLRVRLDSVRGPDRYFGRGRSNVVVEDAAARGRPRFEARTLDGAGSAGEATADSRMAALFDGTLTLDQVRVLGARA